MRIPAHLSLQRLSQHPARCGARLPVPCRYEPFDDGAWTAPRAGRRYTHSELGGPAILAHKGKVYSIRSPAGPAGVDAACAHGGSTRLRGPHARSSVSSNRRPPALMRLMTSRSVANTARWGISLRAEMPGDANVSQDPPLIPPHDWQVDTHDRGAGECSPSPGRVTPAGRALQTEGETASPRVPAEGPPVQTANPLRAFAYRGTTSPVNARMRSPKRRIRTNHRALDSREPARGDLRSSCPTSELRRRSGDRVPD
ncbi:hypothetical protein BC628DRAFT_1192296 [Trametes gibbosa]|nr:hypothetical protein BC628DRAFT_1192296 [Trametes gibbosa]